ncbi:MAG: hypothetical protein U9R60_02820, partial [Bacteroidota bacterium]|nr:hypothetical protein [Bacteroidota bacterium]
VLNKEQMGHMQSTRQNILSYFLMSSDLKGTIENPGFYFRKDNDKQADLDALLLTQGWRKYLYTKPTGNFPFQPEPKLTVSGSVSGIMFKNKKKKVELTMMTFGHSRSVQSQTTDNQGRFNFSLNDEYGEEQNILIQSTNKSGKKKNFSITIERNESPNISFDHKKTMEGIDSIVHELVEKNIERKTVEDAYRLSKGTILLEEVVVEGYNMTSDRKKVMKKYGMPDEIITGEDLQEKKQEWSTELFAVLKNKFPEKIFISRVQYRGGGFLMAHVNSDEMTLVVIDGVPANRFEYPMLAHIPISEVKGFEIIVSARNFAAIFRETFPSYPPLGAPPTGNVIAIYTRAGEGMAGIVTPVGMLKTNIPVFSPRREFYAPKYDNIQPDDWYKPDLRALVHWEPNIMVNSLGKASRTFYNGDNLGEMLVVVEAISENGELGYQELTYKVKKNENGY